MIVKLNGADFSANNIGQVRTNRELNDFTKSAIIASGNESLTDEQKYALDDLFLAMGVDGSNNVMSKMRRVYLPIIAGDVTKAVINYKDNSFTVDKEIDSTHWELRSHGLVGKASGQNIVLTEPTLLGNNFCQFFLRTEKVISGVDDTSYSFTLRGKTNTNLWLGLAQQSVSSNTMVGFGTYGAAWGSSISKQNDMIKASGINSYSTGYNTNVLGEWEDSDTPKAITSDMSGESNLTLYVLGLNTTQLTKAYGVLMLGEAITAVQAKDICAKIDALYDTFAS